LFFVIKKVLSKKQGSFQSINLAIKYPNSVIPACPESFFEFNLLRRSIPEAGMTACDILLPG
jgi:hypothetical protein